MPSPGGRNITYSAGPIASAFFQASGLLRSQSRWRMAAGSKLAPPEMLIGLRQRLRFLLFCMGNCWVWWRLSPRRMRLIPGAPILERAQQRLLHATAPGMQARVPCSQGCEQPVYRRACCLGGRSWLAHVAWCPALHGLAQTPARQRPRRTQPDAHGAKPSPNSTMPNVRGSSFNRDRSRRALQHRSRLLPAPPGAAPRSRRRRTATSSCARRLGAEVVRNARCGCDTCMRGFPARASGCWGALLNSCLRRR